MDRIKRSRDELRIWEAVLANVSYEDAESALIEHFGDPDRGAEYLKPAHITRILRDRRRTAQLRPSEPDYCVHHPFYPTPCHRCAENARLGIENTPLVHKPIGEVLDQLGRDLTAGGQL